MPTAPLTFSKKQIQALKHFMAFFGASTLNMHWIHENDLPHLQSIANKQLYTSSFTPFTFTNRDNLRQMLSQTNPAIPTLKTMWVCHTQVAQGRVPLRIHLILLEDGILLLHSYQPSDNEHNEHGHIKHLIHHIHSLTASSTPLYKQCIHLTQEDDATAGGGGGAGKDDDVSSDRKADYFWINPLPSTLPKNLQDAIALALPSNKNPILTSDQVSVLKQYAVLFQCNTYDDTWTLSFYDHSKRRKQIRCKKPSNKFLELWSNAYPEQAILLDTVWTKHVLAWNDPNNTLIIHHVSQLPVALTDEVKRFVHTQNEQLITHWINQLFTNGSLIKWLALWTQKNFHHTKLHAAVLAYPFQRALESFTPLSEERHLAFFGQAYHWLPPKAQKAFIETMHQKMQSNKCVFVPEANATTCGFIRLYNPTSLQSLGIPYQAVQRALSDRMTPMEQMFFSKKIQNSDSILLAHIYPNAFKKMLSIWEKDDSFMRLIEAMTANVEQVHKNNTIIADLLHHALTLTPQNATTKRVVANAIQTLIQEASLESQSKKIKSIVHKHRLTTEDLSSLDPKTHHQLGVTPTNIRLLQKKSGRGGSKKQRHTRLSNSSTALQAIEAYLFNQLISDAPQEPLVTAHLSEFKQALAIMKVALQNNHQPVVQLIFSTHQEILIANPTALAMGFIKSIIVRNESMACLFIQPSLVTTSSAFNLLQTTIAVGWHAAFDKMLSVGFRVDQDPNALFMEAVVSRNHTAITKLIAAGINPEHLPQSTFPPLFMAASLGLPHIAVSLISHKAALCIDMPDQRCMSIIACAATANHLHVVEALTDQKVDVNAGNVSALMMAVSHKNTDMVRTLLTAKADPNPGKWDTAKPIHLAAQDGCTTLVTLLAEAKADLNRQLPLHNGISALYQAASAGHTHTVKALLQAKADPNPAGMNESISVGIRRFHPDLAIILIEKGANPNGMVRDCQTTSPPIFHAISLRHYPLVATLLQHRATINQTHKGITPLEYAVATQEYEMATLLLKWGAGFVTQLIKGVEEPGLAALLTRLSDPTGKKQYYEECFDQAIEIGDNNYIAWALEKSPPIKIKSNRIASLKRRLLIAIRLPRTTLFNVVTKFKNQLPKNPNHAQRDDASIVAFILNRHAEKPPSLPALALSPTHAGQSEAVPILQEEPLEIPNPPKASCCSQWACSMQ